MSWNTAQWIVAAAGLLFGAFGVLFGLAGIWQSRRANLIADKSLIESQRANEIAIDALSESREANKIADEQRDIAQESAEVDVLADQARRRARVVIEQIWVHQLHPLAARIGVGVSNVSSSVIARNIRMVVFRNEEPIAVETSRIGQLPNGRSSSGKLVFDARYGENKSANPDDVYRIVIRFNDDLQEDNELERCVYFTVKGTANNRQDWTRHDVPCNSARA